MTSGIGHKLGISVRKGTCTTTSGSIVDLQNTSENARGFQLPTPCVRTVAALAPMDVLPSGAADAVSVRGLYAM
jgi:hypothetical protein